MRRIIADDSAVFSFSPEKVYSAVSDMSTYEKWWGKKVKVKVLELSPQGVGSKVEVHAVGGWFRCEIISLKPFEEAGILYYDGVQKGKGIWSIEKLGAGKTKLSYSIDLEPNGFVPRFLSNFMNFSKLHSQAMKDLFSGLENFLA
ncbi:MAG TPA: SRPBCC family protein [Leptospiraceae bacterium]|nr:SRPBCC family protein [Leptospiraceae bacterium]HMY66728.1 SRPBCC family protein [Leptospiraceae bacterium]HNN02239.1 SRPBCC family protein [Leptospiraceae bacterium]